MDDDRRYFDAFHLPDEVEIAQTLPNRLLNATHHPERREVCRFVRIGEISGHSQLESALAVGRGISLPESRRRQIVTQALDRRTGLTTRELHLELPPILQRQRRRIDQRHSTGVFQLTVFPLPNRVE